MVSGVVLFVLFVCVCYVFACDVLCLVVRLVRDGLRDAVWLVGVVLLCLCLLTILF